MDKDFCQQIENESLVEQYVAGTLSGELLEKFERHLKECEKHAGAVVMEKALKHGISEFARDEIKLNLKNRLKKREDTRFLMLRYAAILFVAVIAPLLLYYQLNVAPNAMTSISPESEKSPLSEEPITGQKPESFVTEEPGEAEQLPKNSEHGIAEKKVVQPAAPEGAVDQKHQPITYMSGQVRRPNVAHDQISESEIRQKMLQEDKASSLPKSGANYSAAQKEQMLKTQPAPATTQGYGEGEKFNILSKEINNKMEADSLAIKRCIADFIDINERQKYLLRLSINVFSDGKIGEIKIIEATVRSSDLEACLFGIIKAWKLPSDIGEGFVIQDITYR